MKSSKILLIILVAVFFACSQKPDQGQSAEGIMEETTPTAVINVDELLGNPDEYVGQKIQISGLVTHVCKHSGKRLHLTSATSNQMIRVEASTGINQFQRELEGSDIVVEGIMQKEVINEDYLAKWENEQKGEFQDHSEAEQAETEEQIQNMRQRLAESGKSELVTYWVDGNSYKAE